MFNAKRPFRAQTMRLQRGSGVADYSALAFCACLSVAAFVLLGDALRDDLVGAARADLVHPSDQPRLGAKASAGVLRHVVATASTPARLENLKAEARARGLVAGGVGTGDRIDLVGSKGQIAALLESDKVTDASSSSTPELVDVSTPEVFDPRFIRPEQIAPKMDAIVRRNPDLAERFVIGKSFEGRDMDVLRLSGAPRGANVPRLVFDFGIHSREVATTVAGFDLMHYLLSGSDEATRWLENTETYFLGLNPDGAHRVFNGEPLWRKNARATHADGVFGVDLNRNAPFDWGCCGWSSDDKFDAFYRGAFAGSEPETQTFMKLIDQINPLVNVSLHAYGGYVFVPFGRIDAYTPQQDLVLRLAKDIAAQIPHPLEDGNYQAGAPWETLYPLEGTTTDWVAGERQGLGLTVEMGDSFHPTFEDAQAESRRLLEGWRVLYNRVLGPSLHGQFDRSAEAVLDVFDVGRNRMERTGFRADKEGRYRMLLEPGRYRVTSRTKQGEHVEELNIAARPVLHTPGR